LFEKGKGFGRSILILGEHAKVEELPESKKKDPLKLPKKNKLLSLSTCPAGY